MELLTAKGIQPEVVEYLNTPPSKAELADILDRLNLQPRELMRTHEAAYKYNNLHDDSLSREQLIAAMIRHPILIERPIIIHNGKASIGRPTEKILDIL
jgi:arsenate reductase